MPSPMKPQRRHPPKGRPWTIFVSHAGPDTWVARQIAGHIEAVGAKPFLDEAHIAIGEDFEEEILAALDTCRELLVLLTPWSLQRPYVWAEIGAAWVRRIPVLGVPYGLTPESLSARAAIPLLLKKRNLVDINDLDRYFRELKVRIARARQRGSSS
jgi:hypothetical protein